MSNNIAELYCHTITNDIDWKSLCETQQCTYLNKRCVKSRKSTPEHTIGTCSVIYGRGEDNIIICPHRLLERKQIFMDCIHLLHSHEPGNELHLLSEISIPGGNVDYFLVSTRNRKVKDFVGIELQTLDTTGTVWPYRQRFLASKNIETDISDRESNKPYGMNWKMTAKTILVQMHHKLETFEHLHKHLVLVVQDKLLDYMKKEFSFGHISDQAKNGDSLHFHSYKNELKDNSYQLSFFERKSTDVEGVSLCLGLETEAKIELIEIITKLESKINDSTLFTF